MCALYVFVEQFAHSLKVVNISLCQISRYRIVNITVEWFITQYLPWPFPIIKCTNKEDKEFTYFINYKCVTIISSSKSSFSSSVSSGSWGAFLAARAAALFSFSFCLRTLRAWRISTTIYIRNPVNNTVSIT